MLGPQLPGGRPAEEQAPDAPRGYQPHATDGDVEALRGKTLSWPQREGPGRAGLRPICPGPGCAFPRRALAEKTSLLQGAFAGHIVVSAIPVPPPRLGLIRPGHNFLMRQLPAI